MLTKETVIVRLTIFSLQKQIDKNITEI